MRHTVSLLVLTALGTTLAASASAFQPPDQQVDFANSVMPLISRLGCNQTACHGSSRGKGGLHFSLFGGDAAGDYAALTHAFAGRRVNPIEPEKSLLLTKTTGAIPHTGGTKLPVGSPEYALLLNWIAQGVPYRSEQNPALVGISFSAAEYMLPKGESLQLAVTAHYANGTESDVTRDALFHSNHAAIASVSEAGVVTAEEFGESIIVVRYLRQFAVTRIVTAQPLTTAWAEVPVNNRIDELVFAKLQMLGIPPSDLCTDQDFVRRVYLDTIGLLPTPDEVRGFLADADPQKRSKLIDHLLQRSEFADFWSLKWGDLLRIKSEFPVNVWPKAVQVYYRWLHDSLEQNKPYDQFVRELLTSDGSNFRTPPVNFFRAMPGRTPQAFAETTALIFMGVRFNCVRCHAHPMETWTVDDDLAVAAFFSKVALKSTLEWKEEIVYFNADGALWHPRSKQLVKPKVLGGEALELGPDEDPRIKFTDWLTSPQNPWFAKNAVNRVWSWLLGRGIVHEADDMRSTNPPENPELLDYLSQELVSHQFDLKHVYRLILNSRVYQLSSYSNPLNDKDVAHFSHYQMKRLGAEQVLDAIGQATGSTEPFYSWIPVPSLRLPSGYKATQLPDSDIDCTFLDVFGRPSRDTPYEGDRDTDATARQAMFFVSSDSMQWKIAGGQRIRQLLEGQKTDAEVIEEIYLAALSRFPSEEEKQKTSEFLAKHTNDRGAALQDVLWAVLNTKEFLVNH